MDRVGLFLAAVSAAGLDDRGPSCGRIISDFASGWGVLASTPAALRPLRRGCASVQRIWEEEAAQIGVCVAVLKGRNRTARVAAARHEAWRRMMDERGMSLKEIGRPSGHHHTSVLHGVRQARMRRAGRDYER